MRLNPASYPTVERDTTLGRVRGFVRNGVEAYLGLRYAEKPERFKVAPPSGRWEGTYDATQWRPMAMQPPPAPMFGMDGLGGFSEDCFFLNIYRPAAAQGPLPVFFWIHGGAFMSGAGNSYNGMPLALGANAIVVTIHYRLGLLGTLDVSELGTGYESSEQLWLADQLEALRWVNANIADYGGDPSNITIAGESAGGTSVISLMICPQAKGLFQKAFPFSPARLATWKSPDKIATLGKRLQLDRDGVKKWLLTASAEDLIAQQAKGYQLNPTTNTLGPLTDPSYRAAVPVMTGFASHEGDFFIVASQLTAKSKLQGLLVNVLTARYISPVVAGGKAAAFRYRLGLRRTYPLFTSLDFVDRVWTDLFRRTALETALAATELGQRGYVVELDLPCAMGPVPMRSTHAVDIGLTFNAFADPEAQMLHVLRGDEAAKLATQWVEMIGQFLRTGDPSGPVGEWPAYDRQTRATMYVRLDGVSVKHDGDRYARRGWGERD